jgi:hypothetical protein
MAVMLNPAHSDGRLPTGVSRDDVQAVAAYLPERRGDGAHHEVERIEQPYDGPGFTSSRY